MLVQFAKKFLFLFSMITAVTLVFFELTLSFLPFTTSFAQFLPQYRISGVPANVSSYVTDHPFFSHATKPHFDEIIETIAHGIKFHLQTDQNGFRNEEVRPEYIDVFVGDSVTFGYGVEQRSTFASMLDKHRSTYNLSIPGAGPATYMALSDWFLKKYKTQLVTFIFFLGNDPGDLEDETWEGLNECQPAVGRKILRSKIPRNPDHPDPWYYTWPVRHSKIVFQYFSLRKIFQQRASNVSAEAALGSRLAAFSKDLTLLNADTSVIDQAKNRVRKNTTKLLEIGCLQKDLNADFSIEDAYSLAFSARKANCDGFTETHENILSVVFQDLFFLLGVDQIRNHTANYVLLRNALKRLPENITADSRILLQSIENKLRSKEFDEELATSLQKVQFSLNDAANSSSLREKSNCSKESIFAEYLAGLAEKGYKTRVILIPNQNQALGGPTSVDCGMFSKQPAIKCVDFTEDFRAFHRANPGVVLTLDGAHLNSRGHRLVADLINIYL